MKTRRLLRHQSMMLQAPYENPDIRYFFKIAGYGCLEGEHLLENDKGERIPISEWKGGMLRSYDGEKEVWRNSSSAIYKGKGEYLRFVLNGRKDFRCSDKHRLLTPNGWKHADSLSIGDMIMTIGGFCRIEAVFPIGEKDKWDMEVEGTHCYYDADGVLNHNSGKSTNLIQNLLQSVSFLQGKKDSNGNDPRIMLCAITISFLEKSVLLNFEQLLKEMNMDYKWNKKNNIIRIGNVDIIVIPTENPDNIYGFDVHEVHCDELDEMPTNIAMETVSALNQRLRQNIEGTRPPFACFYSTAQGLRGIYQTVTDFREKKVPHMVIRASTRDNIYLPKEYVDSLYASMNEEQAKCYLDGEFLAVESRRVFPDYRKDRNMLDYDFYPKFIEDEDYKDIPIFIGMDFNCIAGNAIIETIDGGKPMRDIAIGDYVLTRKGYGKVLNKIDKGVKMVIDFNKNLSATKDHVAITPQGDVELCKAKNLYFLKDANTASLKSAREALKALYELRKSYSTAENIIETVKGRLVAPTISHTESINCFIGTFTNIILEKLKKDSKSTIRTELMTTDLKALCSYHQANMRNSILEKEAEYMAKKAIGLLNDTILPKSEKGFMEKCRKTLGRTESTIASLFALIAIMNFIQESEPLKDARYAEKGICSKSKEKDMSSLNDFVGYAENLFQQKARRHIAKNIRTIGNDRIGNERTERVYDLMIEDCHEFFANGILVHNCFGQNAVAAAIIDNAIVFVKDYELSDLRESGSVFRTDFPTQPITWIPDATGTDKIQALRNDYAVYGIKVADVRKNPPVNDRIFACNSLFYMGRMFLCPVCEDLHNSLIMHQRDRKTGEPEKGGKGAPDHKTDCLAYAVSYILRNCHQFYDLYSITFGRAFGIGNKALENMV